MSDRESDTPKKEKKSTTIWNGLRSSLKIKKKNPANSSCSQIDIRYIPPLDEKKLEDKENDDDEVIVVNTREGASNKADLLRPRSVSSYASNSVVHPPSALNLVPKARKKPQFGIPLTTLAENFPAEKVPEIITHCVEILKKDLLKEGIFRIPGRMTNILEMKISFEQGSGFPEQENNNNFIHDVAGLFTQFFRELPEPLLMYNLYPDWISVARSQDDTLDKYIEMLKQLPKPNYAVLKYVIEFLTQVAKHSGANRMGTRNLALIFGASFLNPPITEKYDLENIKLQCEIIENFIIHFSYIFEGNHENVKSVQSVRLKQVATIPAGPAIPRTELTPRSMKKLKFFHSPRYSGNSHGSLAFDGFPSKDMNALLTTRPSIPQQDQVTNSPREKEKHKLNLLGDVQTRKDRKRKHTRKENRKSLPHTEISEIVALTDIIQPSEI